MSLIEEKKITELQEDLDKSWQKLRLDEKLQQIKALELEVAKPELWLNPENAKTKHETLAHLSDEIEPWQLLKTQLDDLHELLSLDDAELETEVNAQIEILEQKLLELKKALRFTGDYDHNNAILRITAGVGGTEAMDWASMLERFF